MKNSTLPKQQHYVPQFILRNFRTCQESDQVYAFDKHQQKVFRSSIRNVAAEQGFYNIDLKDRRISIEPALADLEGKASGIVEAIVRKESLAILTREDRYVLSVFIAVQFMRCPQRRSQIRKLNEAIGDLGRQIGATPEQTEEVVLDEEKQKQVSLELVIEAEKEVALFYEKYWLLMKTEADMPFYISDSPVTMLNRNNYAPLGNLGLAGRVSGACLAALVAL